MGGCLTFLRTMRCFGDVLSHVFCLESHEKVEDLCDKVRTWWKLYRCEAEKNVSTNKERENRTNKRLKQVRLVTGRMLSKLLIFWYWKKIGTIKNDSGQLKYPQLSSLAKFVLSIGHRNSVPEKVFSIKKHLLDIHRNSTKGNTIIALRMVKDHMLEVLWMFQ